MKLTLISLLLLTGFSIADVIEQIRIECNFIDISLETYTMIENNDINVYKDVNPVNYSFESGDIYRLAVINLVRYYNNDEIKKATVKLCGDRQELLSEYYYKNDSLIFVYKTQTHYKKPKWSDDFNESDKDIVENRFYFNDYKLIKWIDSNKNVVDFSSKDSAVVKTILHDSALYQNYSKP